MHIYGSWCTITFCDLENMNQEHLFIPFMPEDLLDKSGIGMGL